MTTQALICEKWLLSMDGLDPSGWFLDWVLRRPKESSAHITASYAAYLSLREFYPGEAPFRTAVEYFGGLGCQSLIIQGLFSPAAHTIIERHPQAVRHLQTTLAGRANALVRQADSRHVDVPADLVGLDFGDLTIRRAQAELRPLLSRVFASSPRAVVLTDIAGPHLHLNREDYAQRLGLACPDYPTYLDGLAAYLGRTYGYRVLRCYQHHWSAVMALVPGQGDSPPVERTPERPRGIELIRPAAAVRG